MMKYKKYKIQIQISWSILKLKPEITKNSGFLDKVWLMYFHMMQFT